MTFAASETSIRSGQPVELYDFSRRAVHWRYTGADRDIAFDGATYSAGTWSTNGYTASGDTVQQTLTITAPLDAAVADQFRVLSPSDPVLLRVLRWHPGDADAGVWWIGQITHVSRLKDHLEIAGESIVSAQQALGLRLAWQKSCPFSIYDVSCTLDPTAFAFTASVASVTGATVTAAAFADPANVPPGRLAGGFLSWDAGSGFTERRAIAAHSGDTITLLNSTYGLAPAMTVTAHPGCDQSAPVCNSVFNNLPNFGGVPGLPAVNPFNQTPFI